MKNFKNEKRSALEKSRKFPDQQNQNLNEKYLFKKGFK